MHQRRFAARHLSNFMPHSLYQAITHGDIVTVQLYLVTNKSDRRSMNVRTFFTCMTPLMLAAHSQQLNIVQMLLANNLTDVSFCNANGKSAISIAMHENNKELVMLLLADPRMNLQGIHLKLLEWAVSNGHDDIVTQLLQSADAQLCVNDQLSPDGKTLISVAVDEGQYQCLKALVDCPVVNVNADFEANRRQHQFYLMSAKNKESYLTRLPADQQECIKAIICHNTCSKHWRKLLGTSSPFYDVLRYCGADVARFLINYPDISFISEVHEIPRTDPAYYQDRLNRRTTMLEVKYKNEHCSVEHLIEILIQCPQFNINQPLWTCVSYHTADATYLYYKTTVEYLSGRGNAGLLAKLAEHTEANNRESCMYQPMRSP